MSGGTALVTGGCGFVGRHVVSRLLAEGWDVWVIDNTSTGKPPEGWVPAVRTIRRTDGAATYVCPGGASLTFIPGDVRQVLRAAIDARMLPPFNLVCHLAAVVGGRMKIDGDPLAVATDLSIDAEFFNWAIRANPDRVLYASSSAAYPVDLQESEGHVALREDMIDFERGRLGMPDMTYGWAKLTGEYLARIAAQKYGLHVACVRPFSGYGEDQDESYPVPAIAARAARREDPLTVWGSGQQGRDFVHIDDCVEAMLRAVEVISDGSAVNIGSGKLTTFLEVAAMFARLEGYEPEIKPLVDKPVGVQARYADPSRARQLLGWAPSISLEEGFRRVLEAARRRHASPLEVV
ncbi:NAD-dependent epimerase/dehydratase [Thermobaculum terrenum ATCC BAA-798]|uniref:NAD-dependent epimerase/dehydratase n=1 Tax=Thermobaculum terrenum (strain ATCC BAA-798 / CCMEE 7001 / YNP1) TaxID=525904 RepID=D1CIW1_THET1|nr:NAD-dependent epimerase/dehydratase family protein [Thermobaculum terrenum]ACZ43681.1 NAD-dependent epimerase/dehydratase [Thermobaculum terrenum ATCC BAA-798]